MTIKVGRVRIKGRGIRELLKSEPVQADLVNRAFRVADEVRFEAADIRIEGVPGRVEVPVTVTLVVGKTRARARVNIDHPAGLAVEAKHGILTSSIDAARDA